MVREDFTPAYCEGLVKIYGSAQAASREIAPRCTTPFSNNPPSARSVERWIYKALPKPTPVNTYQQPPDDGSPTGERITRRTEATYEVIRRDADGSPTVFQLKRESVSKVPNVHFPHAVDRAKPTTITFQSLPYVSRPISYGVVVSDVQFGFLKNQLTNELEPIHDPTALSVAKCIIADIRPTSLFFIGDFVDWPTFSRWQKYPEYYGVMQPTIDGAHRELGEIIAAAGNKCKRRIMVGSNHQQRPEKFLLEHNMEALSIRRASSPGAGWPVFSEQYLLRYDDLGLEFSGQYPGGEYWVNDSLVLTHAPSGKLEFAADTIHGHTHRLTSTSWSQHSAQGRKNYFQYDCGCLCQLGTTTNKESLHATRVPSDRGRVTDWAQGFAVISQIGDKHEVQLVKIENGSAIYGGKLYESLT